MLKSTIIAIMLLMMSLSAGASRFVMSYADYVHLSDAQKDAYIMKLMELTVELESRYKKETAEFGFSQERFERYSKVLKTLQSIFFIDSAYADPRGGSPTTRTVRGQGRATGSSASSLEKKKMDDWKKFADEFDRLMNTRRTTDVGKADDNCIFAGWVSRVRNIGGKPTCAHPDFIDGIGPERHRSRMAEESKGYPYPDQNSSCSKDDKTMIQCNPLIFGYKSASKQSLFCVEAKDGAKNSSFHCMQLALKDEPKTADVDSKDERLKYLREKLANTPKAFDQVWEFTYKTCVCPTVQANKAGGSVFFSQSYQNHVRPHRTCYGLMDMMGATALECTSEFKFPLNDTKIFSDLRTRIKRESISEAQADVEYSKYLTDMNANKSAEYARICGGTATPEVIVTPKDEDPVVVPDPVATYSCTGECTIPAAPAAAGGSGASSSGATTSSQATEANPTTPAAMTCAYVVKKKVGETETDAELDAPPTEVPPNKEATTISIKAKIKGGSEQTLSCNLSFKDAPKDEPEEDQDEQKEDPSVEVTIDACPGNSCKLTAKPEEGKSEGWSIKWTFKDLPTGVTPPEGWKKPDDTPLDGQVSSDEPVVTPAGGGEKEITQPKLAKEYNVCAVMTKDNKDSSKGPSCKPVPAQAPAPAVTTKPAGGPAAGGPNTTPPPPQTQIRGSSDTSAIGIK